MPILSDPCTQILQFNPVCLGTRPNSWWGRKENLQSAAGVRPSSYLLSNTGHSKTKAILVVQKGLQWSGLPWPYCSIMEEHAKPLLTSSHCYKQRSLLPPTPPEEEKWQSLNYVVVAQPDTSEERNICQKVWFLTNYIIVTLRWCQLTFLKANYCWIK